MDFAPIAAQLINRPAALDPAHTELVTTGLADRLSRHRASQDDQPVRLTAADGFSDPDGDDLDRPYQVIQGVAIIPVRGLLIQRLGYLWDSDYIGGYDIIRMRFLMALRDPDVAVILFDINSPGGMVAGCFDLVDTIYNARGAKPIAAVLSENAYSAAYAIASAVDPGRIYLPRTGGVGSVGVIWMHVDLSKALDGAGIGISVLTYGARKADGSPTAPLSDEARERYQGEIDTMGAMFVSTVARNRGMTVAAVRATQAGCFMGVDGVEIGFADVVAPPDEAFRRLLAFS